ncbi:MAG: hypothetical protein ACRC2B_09455 [Rubrivivax sp.]
MTLNELKGKYTRLSNEIDTLAGAGERNESRLVSLLAELDEVHRDLADLRRRTLSAPTLRDVVAWAHAAAIRPSSAQAASSGAH